MAASDAKENLNNTIHLESKSQTSIRNSVNFSFCFVLELQHVACHYVDSKLVNLVILFKKTKKNKKQNKTTTTTKKQRLAFKLLFVVIQTFDYYVTNNTHIF